MKNNAKTYCTALTIFNELKSPVSSKFIHKSIISALQEIFVTWIIRFVFFVAWQGGKAKNVIQIIEFCDDKAEKKLRKKYINNEGECFIRLSKHRESDENARPQAEGFYCFELRCLDTLMKHEAELLIWLLSRA